jgi:hypothetical protein
MLSVMPPRLRLFSLPFAAGALYHAAGLLRPAWTEPAPPWRHALFILINATAAAGLWRYRRAFFAGYCLLALQQLYGHSVYGWGVWRAESRVDWASVAVVLFMPALLWALRPSRGGHSAASDGTIGL